MKVETEVKNLKPLIQDEVKIKIKNARPHKPNEDEIRASISKMLFENMDPKTTIQEYNIILEVICDMILNTWYYLKPED